jgi:hypothetical protein
MVRESTHLERRRPLTLPSTYGIRESGEPSVTMPNALNERLQC